LRVATTRRGAGPLYFYHRHGPRPTAPPGVLYTCGVLYAFNTQTQSINAALHSQSMLVAVLGLGCSHTAVERHVGKHVLLVRHLAADGTMQCPHRTGTPAAAGGSGCAGRQRVTSPPPPPPRYKWRGRGWKLDRQGARKPAGLVDETGEHGTVTLTPAPAARSEGTG
jgi:hypothetical protein